MLTATSVFSFRTSFVKGLVSWVLRTLIITTQKWINAAHICQSAHMHMHRLLVGVKLRLRRDSKAAHFSQSSMADRSYTWPSAVDTGSVITSRVIEHIDLHGTFPSELHGAAHTAAHRCGQMRSDARKCAGDCELALTNPALQLRTIPGPALRHSRHVRALRSARTSMHDT